MKDWRRGAAVYQIYPRSFKDSNGDGVGDLQGVIGGLDHVASLGVDAVWLSPFFPSPMKDFGYDVADYCGVDPLLGTLIDFDDLIENAHALGLRVIIDQVYSHTSDQHPWFSESRASRDNQKADWYVWADAKPDGSPPNNWQSVFGGPAWEWDARRRQYYLHHFLREQPALNLHNSAAQNAVLEVARFWLRRDVDGYRLDALTFAMHDPQLRDNPPATTFVRPPSRPYEFQEHRYNQSHPGIPKFLERLRAVIDEFPDRFTVAEVVGERAHAEMKEFTRGPKRLHTSYSFDFLYAQKLTPALIKETALEWANADEWPSWAFSNHDAPRAVSRWRGECDPDLYQRLLIMLLASLRGNIFLYQGEELALEQTEVPFERLKDPEAIVNWPATLGRDGARTPMPWRKGAPYSGFSMAEPWLPLAPSHDARAVDVQDRDPDSLLDFTRRALALRKSSSALRTGAIEFLAAPDDVIAFTRTTGDERILCVINLGAVARPFAPPASSLIASAGLGDVNVTPTSLPAWSGYLARR